MRAARSSPLNRGQHDVQFLTTVTKLRPFDFPAVDSEPRKSCNEQTARPIAKFERRWLDQIGK